MPNGGSRAHPPTRVQQIRDRLIAYQQADGHGAMQRALADLQEHAPDDLGYLLELHDEAVQVARARAALQEADLAIARGRPAEALHSMRRLIEGGR